MTAVKIALELPGTVGMAAIVRSTKSCFRPKKGNRSSGLSRESAEYEEKGTANEMNGSESKRVHAARRIIENCVRPENATHGR